jgi:hypothetical protein
VLVRKPLAALENNEESLNGRVNVLIYALFTLCDETKLAKGIAALP